jgi:hypothetical protein
MQAIILVGGLGASNYLGYLLQNEHQDGVDQDRVEILQDTGDLP